MPVWEDYRWLAPIAADLLDRFWPAHPPLFLVGLTAAEAGTRAHFPIGEVAMRRNWAWMVRDGVRQARAAGFARAYLVAEEHIPLAPCHEAHLNQTLPRLMTAWNAVYFSLMGWDNRRFAYRAPLLGEDHHRMRHLTAPRSPRFHLHPALWRLDALERCADLALRDEAKNGSAWHFEKTADQPDADLPEAWKRGCYQIAASRLSTQPLTFARKWREGAERWFYHRLMALLPRLPAKTAARLAEWAGFDDVYCDGPYPLFFSGVLRKGRLNDYLVKRLRRSEDGQGLIARIESAAHEAGFAFKT